MNNFHKLFVSCRWQVVTLNYKIINVNLYVNIQVKNALHVKV